MWSAAIPFSHIYHACIMSYIGFMNGITIINKESHSNALSLLVYIPDTRFLIYYQYLYEAIDVYDMVTYKNGAT